MKITVLGIGLQGRAVLFDVHNCAFISEIFALDQHIEFVQNFVKENRLHKCQVKRINAEDTSSLHDHFLKSGTQLAICMLPPQYGYQVAKAALESGVHFVSTSYAGTIIELDKQAQQDKIAIFPEMGFDPGIDLVLCSLAVKDLDEVHGLYSYGAGIPDPDCIKDNPVKYKISWNFSGVIESYLRPARLLRSGQELGIPGGEIFRARNTHLVEIANLGILEAFPNGDAIKYVKQLGIDSEVKHMGRYTMRWPGHCRQWELLMDLGLLEDNTQSIDDCYMSPRHFLEMHLSPRMQYAPHERDLVVLRVHAWGVKSGEQQSIIYELIDSRDLITGLFAMNRTVGFTASITAQMILDGSITKRGVLSPIKNIPSQKLLNQLKQRSIHIDRRWE